MTTTAPARFLQVPAGLLGTVRRFVVGDRDSMDAVNVLRQIGYELGDEVYASLQERLSRILVAHIVNKRSAILVFEGWDALRARTDVGRPISTIMFVDLVDFTNLSSSLDPRRLVGLLNRLFTEFDRIAEEHGIEKIGTSGDSYMAVAGVPVPVEDHAERGVLLGRVGERCDDLQTLDRALALLALGGLDLVTEELGLCVEVERREQLLHRVRTHAALEVVLVAVLQLAPQGFVIDDLLLL